VVTGFDGMMFAVSDRSARRPLLKLRSPSILRAKPKERESRPGRANGHLQTVTSGQEETECTTRLDCARIMMTQHFRKNAGSTNSIVTVTVRHTSVY